MAENKLVKYFIFPLLLMAILLLVRLALTGGSTIAGWGAIGVAMICVWILLKKQALYTIGKDSIQIRGTISRIVHFSEIDEIRRIGFDELGVAIRVGTRVPGMSVGLFYFQSIGEVMMHTDNDERMVLIRTDDVQIIISPADPNAFISEINRHF